MRKVITGNRSTTQYPDLSHAVGGQPKSVVDQDWIERDYIPRVAKRPCGDHYHTRAFRTASAAYAAIEYVRDRVMGTADDDREHGSAN